MNKVQLIFKGMTEIVGSEKLLLLVLTDIDKKRQIAIVSTHHFGYEIGLRITQTPITEKLLPEVLCRVNPEMTAQYYEILLDHVFDGQYNALLVRKYDLSTTSLRASDAILLAHIAHLNVFMEEELFNRQSTPIIADEERMPLPLNTLSAEMLRNALKRAIAEENYELASLLRDEMNKREKKE